MVMEHLKPTGLCESDAPEIRALAKKITGNKKGRAAATAIFSWVQNKIAYRIVPMVGARGVIRRKPMKGMCFDKTNLFIALCRASGKPARYLILSCDLKTKTKKLPKKAMHAVAEIQLGGKWTVADPAFGRSVAKLLVVPRLGQKTWTKVYSEKRADSLGPILPIMINLFVLVDAKPLKQQIGT